MLVLKTFSMHKKLFTIIELMVVIAMVAMLISLISPSLKKITSESKTLLCKNKLSTIANINSIYLEDYDQLYYMVYEPYNVDYQNRTYNAMRWYTLLEQLYLKPYDESFACSESEIPYTSETRRVSYGYNWSTMGNVWVWAYYFSRGEMSLAHQQRTSPMQITNPSKQIVLGDMNRSTVSFWRHFLLAYYRDYAVEDVSPMPRHSNYSSNFGFMDGHVENLFYDDVAPESKRYSYWDLSEK